MTPTHTSGAADLPGALREVQIIQSWCEARCLPLPSAGDCVSLAVALAAGQAVAEELALTRQTNLAVVQRLQAKINALEAELDASRKAESRGQSYADDLDLRAQYDADNLADACGGYGGERI